METMKELIPVIQEAIKSGSSVAIWYLIVLQGVSMAKMVIGWGFVLLICKGIYSLFNKSLDKVK